MLGNVGFFSHGMDMSSSDTPGVEILPFLFFFMMMNDFGFYSGHGACQGRNSHSLLWKVFFFLQIDFGKKMEITDEKRDKL